MSLSRFFLDGILFAFCSLSLSREKELIDKSYVENSGSDKRMASILWSFDNWASTVVETLFTMEVHKSMTDHVAHF